MKIPAGKYKIDVPKMIYKSGENRKSGREYELFLNFKEGFQFILHTEENKLMAISFDTDIEIDEQDKIIKLGDD